jgi:DNA-binding transcriptional ArsR family regulator
MALNWERLARSAMHPLKVAVLEALENGEASPRNLADDLGQPIASVSFHVRQLRNAGLIELTRTQPRRGALEHFYALDSDVATTPP